MRLSHALRHFGVAVFCSFAASGLLRAADAPVEAIAGNAESEQAIAAPAQREAPAASAAVLVRQALEAEAAGDGARRSELLRSAIAADPSYAPARWHSGQVADNERWTSVDDAAGWQARQGKIEKYRALRDNKMNTADAHRSLAHWCAAEGMHDQERLHLIAALELAPHAKYANEIVRKLGLARYQGRLYPAAIVQAMKEKNKAAEKSMQKWKPQFVKLRDDLESRDTARHDSARERLKGIDDSGAIIALEAVFARAKPEAAMAAVAAVAGMAGQDATDSLVRFAMFAAEEEVRQAAAEALRSRPIFSYMPTLMNALEPEVEVQYEANVIGGRLSHRMVLYQEGAVADEEFTSTGNTGWGNTAIVSRRAGRIIAQGFNFSRDSNAEPAAALAVMELDKNAARAQMNERVGKVLDVVAPPKFGAAPRPWWDWWLDYNGMYQPPRRPVIQSYSPSNVRYISCFVAGTPVMTSTGPTAIEQIKPGDCVLAQNPDSGELAYKPVLGVTVRPPSTVLDISVGGETIRATKGHPFWVDGAGWAMAKELHAGQYLHTVDGPRLIESVAENGEAECHNLVVAEFATYFVGNAKILVHDNNLRQVTTATVPGLVAP